MQNPTAWPMHLMWIVKKLARTKDQELIITPMDRGPPKRRPRTTAQDAFTGQVELDESSLQDLLSLSNMPLNLYTIVAPDTDVPTVVSFKGRPFNRQTTIRGGATTHSVEITLIARAH
jgi:hypothetical protein